MSDESPISKPNPEAGRIWAGWILAEAYKMWPQPVDFWWHDILARTNVGPELGNANEAISGLMSWMQREKFITIGSFTGDYQYFDVTLTEKSLSILNFFPVNSSNKIGDQLIDAASQVGSNTVSSGLGELMGQIIGGIFKSMSGG